MTTVEQVKELASRGLSASEISNAVGVSRQRVYAVAKANGITFPRRDAGGCVAPSPRPRVLTGGVQVAISTSVAGTIAELLVAADLMARGWQVFMPIRSSKGHDIVAACASELTTIEVRSAHRNAGGHVIYSRKADNVSDRYALVVTGEPVIYTPDLPSIHHERGKRS